MKFKPSDFMSIHLGDYNPGLHTTEAMARAAQEAFDRWLSEQLVVYGDSNVAACTAWRTIIDENEDTHKARIIYIEPIVKARPKMLDDLYSDISIRVFGLTPKQIERMKNYYEANTGAKAKDL